MFAQLVHLLVSNLKNNNDEIICDLQCEGLLCLQKKDGYGFTTDAVLLANFIKVNKNSVGVEFCAGSGVISILVNAKQEVKKIYAVEIQKELSAMCGRTLEINGIVNIIPVNMALEEFSLNHKEKVDFVFANPPYYKNKSGKLPQNEQIKICKHEILTNIDSIINSASLILKQGGKLFLVHLKARKQEIIEKLKIKGFSICKTCDIFPMQNKPSHIFLVEAIFNEYCTNKELKPIILKNANGEFTKELTQIYSGSYCW